MFSELSIFITDYDFATPVSIPTTTISKRITISQHLYRIQQPRFQEKSRIQNRRQWNHYVRGFMTHELHTDITNLS